MDPTPNAPRFSRDELDEIDFAILDAVLKGETTQSAFKLAGITNARGYARYNRPLFKATLQEAVGQTLRPALVRLRAAAIEAVDRMIEVMRSRDSKDRLNAAKAVLDYAVTLGNTTELQTQLAVLHALSEPRDEKTPETQTPASAEL